MQQAKNVEHATKKYYTNKQSPHVIAIATVMKNVCYHKLTKKINKKDSKHSNAIIVKKYQELVIKWMLLQDHT